jgi:hypothetical protein
MNSDDDDDGLGRVRASQVIYLVDSIVDYIYKTRPPWLLLWPEKKSRSYGVEKSVERTERNAVSRFQIRLSSAFLIRRGRGRELQSIT